MNVNAPFDWKCQPEAEKFLLEILAKAVQLNPILAKLEKELFEQTSTRLFDWIDHVVIPSNPYQIETFRLSGFITSEKINNYHVYYHPGAQLPRVKLVVDSQEFGIAVSVESIDDFILAHGGFKGEIEGTPLGHYRRCCFNITNGISFWVVERRGTLSLEPSNEELDYQTKYLTAQELWSKRPRTSEDDGQEIQQAIETAAQIIQTVGQNLAAWIVLEVERKYWQSRNTAGQLQKNRQDLLGMGWANHDHHTFRSARRNFAKLVRLFEMLGFHCRERYYAGQEAGWGAQIMENPVCRLVLFLDVDLAAHEIEGDFSHDGLSDLPQVSTIGLWTALHGDSILKAGMHHLEAQFMFDQLTDDLSKSGVKMMNPFSFFPYLKQAFTEGQRWYVEPHRVQKLLKENKITQDQADRFLSQGAIGSHLENLQRREGYKGFNQKNVSIIIQKTDPRLS
ncbi:MAG: hypothetical protein H0W88_10965 [Parachlamydiaceae bacterium]|nr:hypothetical protein [Parachlamydiaceae bacterium]